MKKLKNCLFIFIFMLLIKQIQNDLKLLKSYSYINGEIYLNK